MKNDFGASTSLATAAATPSGERESTPMLTE